MLLERSLTDRVLTNGKPRLQAVIGFNVSVMPPRIANNAVAVVEISLTSTSQGNGGISVVAMMPQENTYNAQATSTKANAFGAAVAVKFVQVGYSQKSTDQTFFVYRDNDTVPFELPLSNEGRTTTFGWMFRPVLGQPSIAFRNRQLFAVIALPDADPVSPSLEEQIKHLTVHVRTYWRRFDRDTGTSFSEQDANRRTKTLYALTLGLAKPLFFSKKYDVIGGPYDLAIRATQTFQTNLQPKISDITWMPTGAKSALVSIQGENFFTESRVAIGDKIISEGIDGLIIKSAKTLEFITTLDALGMIQGSLIGRYGPSIPLQNDSTKIEKELTSLRRGLVQACPGLVS